MRLDHQVLYVGDSGPKEATVRGFVEHGPSSFWVLDLNVGGELVTAVPHKSDSDGHYWTLEPETAESE